MTTTLASSSHEIITPANVIQPRAFVIAKTVAGLLTVASACIPSFPVRIAVSSCAVAGSTTAFDGRGDATGPVPMVEDKSPTLRLASTPIGAGRAFRFRGRWGRLFFMAPYPGPGVGSPDVCRKCTDAMVLVKPATVVLRRPVRPHPGLWTALRVMGTARPQALWRSKFRHLVGVSVLRLVSNSSMRTGVAGFACERRNNTNTVACPGTL